MRNKIINKLIYLIKKKYNYNEIKLHEIKYGLEALYIIITRTLLFIFISILLGKFHEFIIFFITYVIIRSFSFGLHAKSSVGCFIISSIAFIGIPLIANFFVFNITLKIIFSIYFFIIFLLFSPADTPKKPLVNKAKRNKLKIYSLITIMIYIIGIFILNSLISNIIILVLFYQSFLISPLLYKIMNINFNNYLNYKFE
ncbi:MAG: accessory gene regulator B family protein [Bacilli bacterium]|nr:accessory gene regulator B family protein [Bacilli bacterium]MDD4406560.1 accessory gene regulator B family protein [Bacilli bacterium]